MKLGWKKVTIFVASIASVTALVLTNHVEPSEFSWLMALILGYLIKNGEDVILKK